MASSNLHGDLTQRTGSTESLIVWFNFQMQEKLATLGGSTLYTVLNTGERKQCLLGNHDECLT